MEAPKVQKPEKQSPKMAKRFTGKRDDTPLHCASRAGDLDAVMEILTTTGENDLKELLRKQNHSGETVLYVASECGHVDVVREIIRCYDLANAGIKSRNGLDAFHIAAKQGDTRILEVLMEAYPELAMTVDLTNTTALHTSATQGHIETVKFLLDTGCGLAAIARSNGKTALHSAARKGHLEVVKALLAKEPGIATRVDKKGQTALHMAVKGLYTEVVHELLNHEPVLLNMVDNKCNSALHIATRKGRAQITRGLLEREGINIQAVNRGGETAIDTATKTGRQEIVNILRDHGVPSASTIKQQGGNPTRELKQAVSDIKHEVHDHLEHSRVTGRGVQGIAKRLNKMHLEGLNNAINSTTVVAILIATVAFAAIYTVPGQFVDDPKSIPPGLSLGAANIANKPAFVVFFLFDSVAVFISIGVVVVQISLVVIESRAKRKMMAIINKLMWLACALVTVAYLALAFIVVGGDAEWLAIGMSITGTLVMGTTIGTMAYCVIKHRIRAYSRKRSLSRFSTDGSHSFTASVMSEAEILNNQPCKMYAI